MKTVLAAAAALALLPATVHAQGIVRQQAGKFPIASVAVVPPGYSTIYLSGNGADPINKSDTSKTVAAYGDTETQVRSALTKLKATLASLHMDFGDVVQMHIFMVADPKSHKIDFAGMMKAYTEFFGTKEQPNLPTRSAFQVAGLANPGWLVEIELVAAHK